MYWNRKLLFRRIILSVLLILFSVLFGIYLYVPIYIEKKLISSVAESLGFTDYAGEVRRFGFNGFDLALLRLGNEENPALKIDSIRFDYSLIGLWEKHIKKTVINGIEIRAESRDGKLMIPGMNIEKFFQNYSKGKEKSSNDSRKQLPQISFGSCEIRNSILVFKRDGKDYRIPFEFKTRLHQPDILSGDEMSSEGYEFKLLFYPGRDFIQIQIKKENNNEYSFYSSGFSFPPWSGEVSLKADISPVPLKLSMDMEKGKIRICPMEQRSGSRIEFGGEITVKIDEKALRETEFPLKLTTVSASESLTLRFSADIDTELNWNFSLMNLNSIKNIVEFDLSGGKLRFLPEEFSVNGNGKGKNGAAGFKIRASELNYLKGFSGGEELVKGVIPEIEISGDVRLEEAKSPMISTVAKFVNAEFSAGKLYIGKINAVIPFQWPYPSVRTEDSEFESHGGRAMGSLNINEIKYNKIKLGTVSSTLYQDNLGIIYTGQYEVLPPELIVDFSGMAGTFENRGFASKLDFKVSTPQKIVKLNLGKLVPGLKGMFFEGGFVLNGGCSFKNGFLTSNLDTTITDSKIEAPKKNMAVEGIDLDLRIQDLFKLRSLPKQKFKFRRFSWGDIETGEGKVEFQIESPKSFFLERSKISWCEGNIHTYAMRIKPGEKEFNFILYCDRLKLAKVLQQFKAADAEGEGTVNGRVPVKFQKGKIIFEDGFLYSTPGIGGTVKLKNAGLLASGIPVDNSQCVKMAIAQEALKNFNYDWTKLLFNSNGDELFLLMQMDGKPAGLLPFGFDEDNGLYKTGEESWEKANFQGIRFDINFRLPLNRILRYGKGINQLLKKGGN